MDALKSDPLSLLYILTSAMRVGIFRGALKEPAIVEKILRQAAGVPFYLELETQLYDKTPAAERTPEVFGGSQQEQIDRLLTHLDASERATLKLLAAFGIWDRELFSQAVTHFATGYPATGAAELGRFWSIEPIGEGRWQLHNEMAHHLQADERQRDQGTFEKVHRWGFAYFDGPLEGLEAKNIQAEDADRLQRALMHADKIQTAAEWAAWLEKRLNELGDGTIWQLLIAVAERGVQMVEQERGEVDPALAGLLNKQASFLKEIALYKEAENLFRRALAIDDASYGTNHPRVASILNNLAALLQVTNRLEEAEQLMRRSLPIYEASYGTDHPEVAICLHNIAVLLKTTARLAEAEPLYRRALEIDEASYGVDHPHVAIKLNNLARLLQDSNRFPEAEPLMRRSLAIFEGSYCHDHPMVAFALNNLANLLRDTNRLAEAEALSGRAARIFLASLGMDHPNTQKVKGNYLKILQAQSLPEIEIEAKLAALEHPG
jgi:tetratricopeptide (TPR) repeat protein